MLDDVKRPAPPPSEPRKGNPVNAEYERRAKEAIRAAMREGGVSVAELAERLRGIGYRLTSLAREGLTA